jgi:Flp pilus assembly protein TadD
VNKSPTVQSELSAADRAYDAGNFVAAMNHYRRAAELAPANAEIHHRLASAAWKCDDLIVAETHYLRAVEIDPKHVRAHEALGHLYLLRDRVELAQLHAERATQLEPGNAELSVSYAFVLRRTGQINEAYERIVPYLDDPELGDRALLLYLQMAQQLGQVDDAVSRLKRLPPRKLPERSSLHFAAAALLDRLGQYDEAFEQAALAHTTAVSPQVRVDYAGRLRTLLKHVKPGLLNGVPRASHGDTRPVFVVGMPRSGTSLVEQILASHSDVFGAGELVHLTTAGVALDRMPIPYPQVLRYLTEPLLNQKAGEYLAELEKLGTRARCVVDKMPLNFLYLDVIELLFPQAHVIHCRRSDMDTCLSCYITDIDLGRDIAPDLTTLGKFYRGYDQLMRQWPSALRIPLLEVVYEDIVTYPESQVRRLLDFVGLPFEEKCLRFHESERKVATASRDQVRKPIYSTSVGRWRHYEQHLGELKQSLHEEMPST